MNATLLPPSLPKPDGAAFAKSVDASAAPPGKRLEQLIARMESLPDAESRELLRECLQSILALHGDGLARILQLIKNAGAPGLELREVLLRDKLVRSLLLIHNLHPVPLENRLRQALDKIRPYLQSHGGNVELMHLENDHATLALTGTCKSCPSSAITLELAVRQAVEEACPDLAGFAVEGALAQSVAPDHLPADAPRWVVLEKFDDLREGALRPLLVATVPVLFVKVNGNLYAYRNRCPSCQGRLHEGFLASGVLHCRQGHRFDVQRAGRCLEDDGVYLEPFPLLAEDGKVRVSVR